GIFGAVLSFLVAVVPARSLASSAYEAAVAARYPSAAVRFIEQHQLSGSMWNDFGWGGYLIEELPRLPVYVDGRAEMYGQQFLQRYREVASGETDYAAVFDDAGINLALIKPASPLANELRH